MCRMCGLMQAAENTFCELLKCFSNLLKPKNCFLCSETHCFVDAACGCTPNCHQPTITNLFGHIITCVVNSPPTCAAFCLRIHLCTNVRHRRNNCTLPFLQAHPLTAHVLIVSAQFFWFSDECIAPQANHPWTLEFLMWKANVFMHWDRMSNHWKVSFTEGHWSTEWCTAPLECPYPHVGLLWFARENVHTRATKLQATTPRPMAMSKSKPSSPSKRAGGFCLAHQHWSAPVCFDVHCAAHVVRCSSSSSIQVLLAMVDPGHIWIDLPSTLPPLSLCPFSGHGRHHIERQLENFKPLAPSLLMLVFHWHVLFHDTHHCTEDLPPPKFKPQGIKSLTKKIVFASLAALSTQSSTCAIQLRAKQELHNNFQWCKNPAGEHQKGIGGDVFAEDFGDREQQVSAARICVTVEKMWCDWVRRIWCITSLVKEGHVFTHRVCAHFHNWKMT